jgi:LysR family hydrogen peroxide-inducible transcriptional activator
MPTLQQLRYLVAVADTLHFRRAAEQAHVTQPTLSAQLKELEARLGVTLVERSTARVVLTPEGREITARARAALREVAETGEIARRGRSGLTGTLRVGVVQSLGSYLLPLLLPALRKRHPDLGLYMREGLPRPLLSQLLDGTEDLLFFPLPLENRTVVSVPLFREPLLVVMPHDHPLAARPVLAPDDLRGETVLTLEPGHQLYDQVKRLCEAFGAEISRDYEGTSLDTLRQMVAMGMGVSLMPALYVRSEVAREAMVVARPLGEAAPSRDIGLVWRKGAARSTEFADLAETLRTILAPVREIEVAA